MEQSARIHGLEDLERAIAGRYTIDGAIAAGGMSDVYLATDLRHNRKVVLKTTRSEHPSETSSPRFQREIAIVAQMSHPNIVPLYDSGQTGAIHYYVMPYIVGRSLRDRLVTEGRLDVAAALQITSDVGDALSYAHARDVIHRDIKPDNILLESGRALVTDFGVAKVALTPGQNLTGRFTAVGTIEYMSPEQATGVSPIGPQSDMYSLALVLYEMIDGKLPFDPDSPGGVLARKAIGDFTPLRSRHPDVPPHVDAAIRRALRPDPADRYASVGEFLSALRTPQKRTFLGRRLPRAPTMIAATAAVLVLSALVLTRRTLVGRSAVGRIVVAPLENRTGNASLDMIGLMAGDWITDGLQRTGIVEVVPTPTAFEAQRFVNVRRRGDAASGKTVSALAQETGAATVVSGSFYQRAESLLFHVEIADRQGSRLVVTMSNITAPVADPIRGIEQLRDRLMGWFALRYDDRFQAPPSNREHPPTYDAYLAFSEGMTRYTAVQTADALPLFLRAYQRDTSFTPALLYASICLTNLGRWAQADSLLRIVNQRRGELSDYDRAWLDYRWEFLHGNFEAALAAIRIAARLAPQSKAAYNYAVAAFQAGHFSEALAAVESLNPEHGSMRGFAPYWTLYGGILHALGRYDREYELAQRARAMYPDRLHQFTPLLRAMAAKGQLADIARVVRQARELPPDPIGYDFAHLLAETGEELMAHGHREEAAIYFEKTRRWLREKDPPLAKWRLVRTLYALGRLEEARAELEPLRTRDPNNVDYLGMAGVLDARTGRSKEAESTANALTSDVRPFQFGAPEYYAARIAAVLGKPEDAVRFLHQALRHGVVYQALHVEADLAPLRGFTPFEQLLRGES